MRLMPSHKAAAVEFAGKLASWGPRLGFHEVDVLSDLIALSGAFADPGEFRRALNETHRQLEVVADQRPGRDMGKSVV